MANAKSRRTRYSEGEVKRNLFYKFPKYLMLDPEYKHLSANAKLIFMVLLDRHQLSLKNGMVDKDGYVYLIYSREELRMLIGITEKSVIKMIGELKAVGLVEEVRQGQGKPNRIYLLSPVNPSIPEEPDSERPDEDSRPVNSAGLNQSKLQIKTRTGYRSEPAKNTVPSYSKTYISETDVSERGMGAMPPYQNGGIAASPTPNEKESHGELFRTVKLHPWELSGLIEMIGEEKVKDYIGRLDAHIASTGKKYNSHYATIYKWVKEDERKDKATTTRNNQPKTNRFMNFNQRDTDYDAYEKAERALRTNNKQLYDEVCHILKWDIVSDFDFEKLCQKHGYIPLSHSHGL
jgi:transposase